MFLRGIQEPMMHFATLILAITIFAAHQVLSQPPTRTLPTLPVWPTPTPDPGGPLPASCTYSPTATWYKTSGCAVNCVTSIRCNADFPIIVPCGCTRASVAPTTTTICPPASGCHQCTTKWGLYVTTQSNCTSDARVTGRAEAMNHNDSHNRDKEGIVRYARPLQA
ncbi:hypothetical protein QBC36DRAFT_321235 [Triangularia setosa]|uniref:Uncharacterized protein n=1 Tax=Triangularia setosa TaxID=2587417 RepID=A0AAN6WH27_9PEZI|nr:hypothetical protein QBC36DRAFT_321235 [Podospora setosa]